ncbi:MAG TPA: fatty acid desaturase [Chthoniobacterales bacterium]
MTTEILSQSPSVSTQARTRRQNIYFVDGEVELPSLDRRSFSKRQMEIVKSLQRLDTRRNWKILLLFGLWAAGIGLSLASPLSLLTFSGIALSGCSITGLTVLMHESCHSLLSKNKTINRWLGVVCGIPALVSMSAYRSIHLVHHSLARSEIDPDDIENSAPKSIPLVLVYYVVLLAGIYIYLVTVALVGYRHANAQARKHIAVEFALIVAALASAFYFFPGAWVLKAWIFPMFVAGQLANVRGLAEHGLTTAGNPFSETRTVVSNGFVRFFMSNLNFHLEHHLFPATPWYNLRKLHSLIEPERVASSASVYSGYLPFLRDFFKSTWAGILPDKSLVPPHVREQYGR